MSESLFILGDGDHVRTSIEKLLFSGDLAAVGSFSRNLTTAIQQVAHEAEVTMSAHVILAGGDDVLFEVRRDRFDYVALQKLCVGFRKATGSTISFGGGSTIDSAYLNLRRAKAKGGGAIVLENDGGSETEPEREEDHAIVSPAAKTVAIANERKAGLDLHRTN